MPARWVSNDGGFRYIFGPNGGKRPFFKYVVDAYGGDHLSSREVGQEIKEITAQDDPFAGFLLDLWERDLL